jgi:competence ComEA-like helix-hairpin-helix protein
MRSRKSFYFRTYGFLLKLLLIANAIFFSLNCDTKQTKQVLSTDNQISISESAININTASAEELEKLPNIGAKTAREIISHREKFGAFRKPEHLLLIKGVSDARVREMRHLIKIEN